MRVVDMNGRTGRSLPGVAETWVVSDDECHVEPSGIPAWTEDPTMRPQLVLVPGDVAAIRTRMERHVGAGAPRVARVCPGPGGHGYPLVSWVLSPIPEVCERDGWALAVDPGPGFPYPWVELVELARRYPGLPIVAIGAPFDDWTTRPALDATANLVIETSRVVDDGHRATLRAAVDASGHHRFAFGSGGSADARIEAWPGLSTSEAAGLLAGTADALGEGTWKDDWL